MNDEQRFLFDLQGFLVVPGVLSAAELAELNQQLQVEFDAKLTPAVEAVATEFGVDFIFNAGQGGIVWANRSLDLTQAVIDRLNATVP